MIDVELPCCGETMRLVELSDEMRCEACGVVVELAPDSVVAHEPSAVAVVPALAA